MDTLSGIVIPKAYPYRVGAILAVALSLETIDDRVIWLR